MVGDPIKGQTEWAFTQSTSGIIIAILSPFLGAMADAGGRRKPYIFAFQLLLFTGCAALWWAYPTGPISPGSISWAVVAATVGAEMSIVFNNAQLPNIVRPERMGWLSGFGWGLGYCGGLIALGLVLAAQFSRVPIRPYALERLTDPPPRCGSPSSCCRCSCSRRTMPAHVACRCSRRPGKAAARCSRRSRSCAISATRSPT